MLLNLHKKTWMDGLQLKDYREHCDNNEQTVKTMLELVKSYNKVSELPYWKWSFANNFREIVFMIRIFPTARLFLHLQKFQVGDNRFFEK